jgi:cation transport regulator ChaC
MFYFAYGSNMNRAQMAERCPGAIMEGTGVLPDREFRINRRGVATICESSEQNVHGVVWRISEAHESTLDICESVAEGRYRREFFQVSLEGGRSTESLVYVDPIVEAGVPRDGYLEKVITGAIEHELPEAYIENSLQIWVRANSG